LKSACTDSDIGRELERTVDEWPVLEIVRFYRGLGLVLVVLATFIGCVGLVRNHHPADVVALGGGLALTLWIGQRMILTIANRL
jgi:uncharacterized membrane protein YeiB